MIIRARPKYYAPALDNIITNNNSQSELYFNSGRSALRFLFEQYSLLQRKQLIILMQSFNCHVVMESALQSGSKVYIADIKLNDFSVCINDLRALPIKPDVVLITHYQGIPNLDYIDIAQYCRENNILLVDDISQTECSTIQGVEAGSLGDISLRSYTFDKPFSAFRGGSIHFNSISTAIYKDLFIQNYRNIPTEPSRKSNLDLRTLDFLYHYSNEKYYIPSINFHRLIQTLLSLHVPPELIYKLLTLKVFPKILEYSLNCVISNEKRNRIVVQKIGQEKIHRILLQKQRFSRGNPEVQALEGILAEHIIKLEERKSTEIVWNRYSTIDDTSRVKRMMANFGVEASNFNWAQPLHLLYRGTEQVINNQNGFPNSEYASANVVNIPVWSNFFQSIFDS